MKTRKFTQNKVFVYYARSIPHIYAKKYKPKVSRWPVRLLLKRRPPNVSAFYNIDEKITLTHVIPNGVIAACCIK